MEPAAFLGGGESYAGEVGFELYGFSFVILGFFGISWKRGDRRGEGAEGQGGKGS